jgi:hypothetical protein
MKSFRMILATGILALSSSGYAVPLEFEHAPESCKGPVADFFYDLGFKKACLTRSVQDPAIIGLIGTGLIGLAFKRRRK